MLKQNCFIKLSGDSLSDEVLYWIESLSQEYDIVICVGGGTQINEAFEKAGLPVRKFGPLGRETIDLKEKKLARDTLEKNKVELHERLDRHGIMRMLLYLFLKLTRLFAM